MRLLLSFLLIAGLILPASAQKFVDNCRYLHFQGTINKTLKIEGDLIRQDTLLEGYYYYERVGIPIWIHGSVQEDGSFSMKEIDRSDNWKESGLWEGVLTNSGKVRGTWYNPEKTKSYPLQIEETYVNGSAKLKPFAIRENIPLLEKAVEESPEAEVEYRYLHPVSVSGLSATLGTDFFGENFRNGDPASNLKGDFQAYKKEYKSLIEDYEQGEGHYLNWIEVKTMDVVYNRQYLLCAGTDLYTYAGGAHGLPGRYFSVVDLNNGKALSMKDIFREGSEQLLSKKLTRELKESLGIAEETPLSEAGFFVETVTPNENFFVTGKGIGFYYNVYEIAPYAGGPVEIFLSFEKIEAMLKPGSPVSRVLNP